MTTYGHYWADWLYGTQKDAFMVSVYDACAEIDRCDSPVMKAKLIGALRQRVSGSNRDWVEGITDFLDFETHRLIHGRAPLDVLEDSDEYRVLAVVDAAWRHGAFQGLCRTPGGVEWIGHLGEMCAALVHQGFKWVRGSDHGPDDWELPALGEAWCKGAAMWGSAGFFAALDEAGADPDNDAALTRIFRVVAAHHMAGATWLAYRGKHPHKAWRADVRGRAPSPEAVHRAGVKFRWPPEMIDVLARTAEHVNTWVNPPHPKEIPDRTRGFMIGAHTPRILTHIRELAAELGDAAGDLTPAEHEELVYRSASWMSNYATYWFARGDTDDRLLEVTACGALAGVLREPRPYLTQEHVHRMVEWARPRTGHLSGQKQKELLDSVRLTMEVRGRVPGAVPELGSDGTGHLRYIDGAWKLTSDAFLTADRSNVGGVDLNEKQFPWATRFFNAVTRERRRTGVDYLGVTDEHGGCPVCVGNELLKSFDNKVNLGIWVCFTIGVLLYDNLLLGEPGDQSLGSR
ncbi:hypothetical protein [Actinocrispum wychmicini]|uniref:Uncharacterized protein n=1 Tax=Actinocrispum wychmicini TaxID=1213861 RepID=A0A4R2IMX1_9PSEU|nr:hypothetical protein [Actinocrispum wychmicini]TCO45882.1 hypothetical protein EV192_12068 [Actinocrispum wychmicini]